MMPTLRARRGEQGFTLVELVISIAILGVIATAIGAAFVVSAHDSIGVADRIDRSHDAQIASAYLATDVQSAKSIVAAGCTGSGTNLINFSNDGTSASVSYFYGVDGSETQIRRVDCATATDITLVHFAGGAPPCTKVDGGACAPTPAPAAPTFRTVKIDFTESGTDNYQYSLSGSRRVFVNGGLINPPAPAPYGVLALGSGTGGLQLLGGNANLNVKGPILVNSGVPGAVVNQANPGNGIHATGVFQIVQGGTCPNCNSGNTSPLPTTRTQPIPDPFLGLAKPDETGLPVYTDGLNHGPGVYRTKPLTPPNGVVTTLAPGIYILEAGMSLSGNPNTVVSGSNVLLFNGCGRNAPGGCANNGKIDYGGQATLNVSPAQSGLYQGLVIWQPSANTQPITLSGKSNGSLIDGIVYAPGSSGLTVGTGNAVLTIRSIVGTNIIIAGGGTVNVGI
jgi:prepilin-type N-terminal cleavage/methylation domain-containing protein